MARSMRSMAASFSTPVGSPATSRTMVPPGGSGVSRVMPASCNACELGSAMWPSSRLTKTGWPALTASISRGVGRRTGVQSSWSHPPPVIQRPGGSLAANSAMRRRNSSSDFASRNCTPAKLSPPLTKCTCASLKPGSTSLPPTSSTSVPAPIHLRISPLGPTATMRFPRQATASARGWASFTVHIVPISRTRFAAGCALTAPRLTKSSAAERSTAERRTRNPDILRLYKMGASHALNMKQPSRFIAIAAVVVSGAWAQSLEQRVAVIVSRPEYVHARFGMEFWPLDAAKPMYRLNEQQFFIAASTTKLLTEGTALSLLGPDYRFHTRVFRTGAIDRNGTLNGDLILVASGDPNLSNRIQPDGTLAFQNQDHAYDSMPGGAKVVPGDPLAAIRELAALVAKAGIKRIGGHGQVDISLFPEGERELGTGVVISPIAVNDNLIDVTIASAADGSTPRLTLSPATAYVQIANQLKSGPATNKTPEISFTEKRRPDGSYSVTVEGTVPAGSSLLRTYRIPEPSRFAQMTFVEALKDAGVSAHADLTLPAPA